ncbi:TFIIH/NER complex subunit [Chytriomyces hyalinus]|nr:TFIIH/NER complex subunit [Chytriomyces hyalinus]KAJ3263436.1 TFIIH/NER complex subunit [Chytriomyces hyalinus]
MPPKPPPKNASNPEGDVCPVCKSDRYLNPNLKLLVSLCYHKMCESCINRLFLAGAAPCPICRTSLRKSNFVQQTFEDLRVEKEVHYRRKVGKFFNKRLEDFNFDQKKYDDYLEEVEDIMFNLANDLDVQGTNEKVERWRQENKELIAANQSKQVKEDRAISSKLRREHEEKKIRREALILHEVEEARNKELEKRHLIEELANSDKTPEEIMQAYKKQRQSHNTSAANSAALEHILTSAEYHQFQDFDDADFNDAAAAGDDGIEFDAFDHEYVDPLESFVLAQSYQDPWTMDVGVDQAARASGFMPQWSYTRAIMSSFYGVLEGVMSAAAATDGGVEEARPGESSAPAEPLPTQVSIS